MKQDPKQEAKQEASASTDALPDAAAEGGGTLRVCVRFLHYDEVHQDVDTALLRPCWVWRNGEWMWRVGGGALQYLTTRGVDGKSSKVRVRLRVRVRVSQP